MRALFDLFILLLGGERFPDSIIIIVPGRWLDSNRDVDDFSMVYDYYRISAVFFRLSVRAVTSEALSLYILRHNNGITIYYEHNLVS